ncbi:Lpg1974 family pore-forming outer membrane protein [Legionella gresilensis]|uniref:Lpg1974 family pore-forming outer membrane protein n=1 Tax=Legionella gresilensis TaxID=91823 RepID=UPI0010415E1B|nr:Lpg1974 family pore-forming outer membrane protein [Legionella gresilensis]
MVKKLSLMILGLSVSGIAAAGMYSTPPVPTCVPGDVTVPCEASLWNFGVQALYLQTEYNGSRAYLPAPGGLKAVEPNGGWGYRVEGSYHFSTGNDITMNWLHYDVDDDNLGTFSGQYVQLLSTGSAVVLPASFRGFVSNKLEQVNLVLGQHVDFGLFKKIRFYAGGQYSDIQADAECFYNISPIFAAAIGGVRGPVNSDFNGFGPTIGVDYAYILPYGFSLTANASGSILYGTARIESMNIYNNGLIVGSMYASRKQVVPSLEAKVGAAYNYPVAQGLLKIEGGYQALNYFNALQGPSLVAPTLLTNSDFGLHGPYVGVKWLGLA